LYGVSVGPIYANTSVFLHYINLNNLIQCVRFWTFMAVIDNMMAFWVLSCVEFKYCDASEECTASVFVVTELCQLDAEESKM
jgi:hypothetical protein